MDVLIVGASARAAAFSALRAGLRPSCIDLFADRDLIAVCPPRRIAPERYPDGFEALAAKAPSGPWLYTGALENHPRLVDRIASHRPLWGHDGAILRAVRDPIAVADALRRLGLPCPEVRLSPAGLPGDGSWLVKPLASAAGHGIHPLGPSDRPTPRGAYFQERIAGPSLWALFLGYRTSATLAGITRQWIGRPGSPFAYAGSVGPWPVSIAERRRIETLGEALASSFRLVGLFGVDFILRDGHPWPLEINPRYTAAVEVIELALGRSLLAEHRRACDPSASAPALTLPAAPARGAVGKAILFASRPCRFPDLDDWGPAVNDPFAVPRVADLPHPGTFFEPGAPVLTLFASGPNPAACRVRLERRRALWESRLINCQWSGGAVITR